MNAHPALLEIISAHRAAVQADETCFNDAGTAIDEARAEMTYAAEQEAYRHFVAAPCRSAEEVQAKLDYLLNGSVGDRDTIFDCLTIPDYAGDYGWKDFIRSLVIIPQLSGPDL